MLLVDEDMKLWDRWLTLNETFLKVLKDDFQVQPGFLGSGYEESSSKIVFLGIRPGYSPAEKKISWAGFIRDDFETYHSYYKTMLANHTYIKRIWLLVPQERVAWLNLVKTPSMTNAPPTTAELTANWGWTYSQLNLLRPDKIICIGASVYDFLRGQNEANNIGATVYNVAHYSYYARNDNVAEFYSKVRDAVFDNIQAKLF